MALATFQRTPLNLTFDIKQSVGVSVMPALPSADHRLIERDRGQFVPSRRRRMMANVRAERLLKIPAEPSPELRIPGAAAQTRVLSMAGIRLGFLGIRASFQRDNLRRFRSSSPPRSCPTIPSGGVRRHWREADTLSVT